MELAETIETINRQLIEHFGVDTITGDPIWRVVWSEDQFEKRLSNHSAFGIELLTPIVIEAPKYRQWIREKYVLERLVLVPDINHSELLDKKVSYEPIWVFQDGRENYLPPKFEVAKIVVDTIYAAQGKKSLAKYKDPDADCADPEIAVAKQRAKVDQLMLEMYGDESSFGGALVYGEGIAMPQEYGKIDKES